MGWGDAWAGLSQQSFNASLDALGRMQDNKQQLKRDEIAAKAEEAQRKQREQYETRMLEKRASLDRETRQQDFSMRKGLAKQEQSFRAQESAADRSLRERQLEQSQQYNQGQLGLQARGLSLREQEMQMMANRPQPGGPKPMSESEAQRSLDAQFNAIADPESGLSDELRARAAEFMSDPDATPAEKAEALRRLRAQALVRPSVIP